jgi:hypothetical protein
MCLNIDGGMYGGGAWICLPAAAAISKKGLIADFLIKINKSQKAAFWLKCQSTVNDVGILSLSGVTRSVMNCFQHRRGLEHAFNTSSYAPVRAPPSLQQHRSSSRTATAHHAASTAHHSKHRSRQHYSQHRTYSKHIAAGTIAASTAHYRQHRSRHIDSQHRTPQTASQQAHRSSIAHRKHEQFNTASAPCNAGPF